MDSAASAIGLIDFAIKLVQEILRAREELKTAPHKLQKLIDSVEEAYRLLQPLQAEYSNAHNTPGSSSIITPILRELGLELACAHDKIEQYTQSEIKSGLMDHAKALLRQGVVKQNQKTEQVTARIKELLNSLNQAVDIETLLIARQLIKSRPSEQSEAPRVIHKLDELAIEGEDDEECTVEVEVCETHGTSFCPLGASYQETSVTTGSGSACSRPKRSARAGGFEIRNFSKVRFHISVSFSDCFFYVVTYDNSAGGGPPVELFHPNHTSASHRLTSKSTRKFPDQIKFKRDPLSFRIEKSKELRPEDVGQQTVYVLVAGEQLHELQDPLARRVLSIKDIEAQIENGDFFVKKFVFDILPVH